MKINAIRHLVKTNSKQSADPYGQASRNTQTGGQFEPGSFLRKSGAFLLRKGVFLLRNAKKSDFLSNSLSLIGTENNSAKNQFRENDSLDNSLQSEQLGTKKEPVSSPDNG
jgi:hypothetical protein